MEELRSLPWELGRLAVLERLRFEEARADWLFVGTGPRRAQVWRTARAAVLAMSPAQFRMAVQLVMEGV
jgi:hypothetical protein